MNGSQEGRIHGLNTILNVFFLQTRSRICSHRSEKLPSNINVHYVHVPYTGSEGVCDSAVSQQRQVYT
jgi:hypothetical protein